MSPGQFRAAIGISQNTASRVFWVEAANASHTCRPNASVASSTTAAVARCIDGSGRRDSRIADGNHIGADEQRP
jgi:hypothetical protein